ncbi:MAG: PIN domain-containing protein [Pirellulales bacterium]
MKTAFADSAFYVALLSVRDDLHEKAKLLAQSWESSVVTTEYVLLEVANYIRGSKSHEKFGELLNHLLADRHTEIIRSDHGHWERGVELYLTRPDKDWSLTDCISFVVMKERGLTDALTADHHFEQAGFTALLK